MARPFYVEVLDGFFHLTSRGNARRIIFEDARDYRTFIAALQHVVMRHQWRCLAFTLMPNHFHLVLQTPKPTRAAGMRDLKSDYARAFNARRDTDGSVFKARYRPQLIQDDGYLVAAAVYVALNPVRAGLVDHPSQWPWSSYASTVEGRPSFVDASPILQLLDPDPRRARLALNDLAAGPAGPPLFDPALPIVGDEAFVQRHAPNARPPREVIKRSWEQARPTLSALAVGRDQSVWVPEARHSYRYTIKEIASHLGCAAETVRRRLLLWDGETRPL